MGRPVNKNKLQTLVAYYDGGEDQIVRQIGTRKFVLDNGNTYRLVTGTPGAGEMNIIGELADESTVKVAKLSSRQITTENGNTYSCVVSSFNPGDLTDSQVWLRTWVWYND